MSENLNKLFSPVHVVEDISSATTTLDVYDTGKIFFLDLVAGGNVILPTPTGDDMAGWHATFIIKSGSAPDGSGADLMFYTTAVPPSHTPNVFMGSIRSTDGAAPLLGSHASGSAAGSADVVAFQAGTAALAADLATAGDQVSIQCDGAQYYCDALVAQSASFVFLDM